MKKQRRFTSQLDIDAEIIKCHRLILNERRLARVHEIEMKRWWALANDPEVEPGKQEYYRGKGFGEKRLMQRNLTRARRLADDIIPRLARAKAEFKTDVFEFSRNDTAVVLK